MENLLISTGFPYMAGSIFVQDDTVSTHGVQYDTVVTQEAVASQDTISYHNFEMDIIVATIKVEDHIKHNGRVKSRNSDVTFNGFYKVYFRTYQLSFAYKFGFSKLNYVKQARGNYGVRSRSVSK